MNKTISFLLGFSFVSALAQARVPMFCESTTIPGKYVYASPGREIVIHSWGDRDLVASLVIDIGYSNLKTPFRVPNSEWNCSNNICPSFHFDAKTMILHVSLFENDEMTVFYQQAYKCLAEMKKSKWTELHSDHLR